MTMFVAKPMAERDMVSVTVPFFLNISGNMAELVYEELGGHATIKVVTDSLRERYFRIQCYEENAENKDEMLSNLAKDICLFVHTGRHPTDSVKPEPKSFLGHSLARATHVVRQVVEQRLSGS